MKMIDLINFFNIQKIVKENERLKKENTRLERVIRSKDRYNLYNYVEKLFAEEEKKESR